MYQLIDLWWPLLPCPKGLEDGSDFVGFVHLTTRPTRSHFNLKERENYQKTEFKRWFVQDSFIYAFNATK
jgi:hypothetical protein